jgi:hypothetical protein
MTSTMYTTTTDTVDADLVSVHEGQSETPAGESEPWFPLTAAAAAAVREVTRVGWQGWLAPLGRPAGDRRVIPMPPEARLKTRELPMAFFWQRQTSHGGQVINGANEVGATTYAAIRQRPDRNGEWWMWGEGYINLCDPDGVRYAGRLEQGMSRWVSVELDFDPDYQPPPSENADGDVVETVLHSPTDDPQAWRLMNVTAVSKPAFDGAVIELVDDLGDLEPVDDPQDEDALQALDEWENACEHASPMPDTGDNHPAQSAPGAVSASAPAAQSLAGSGAEVTAMDTQMTIPPLAAEYQPPTGISRLASGGSSLEVPSGGTPVATDAGSAVVAVATGDTSLPLADRDTKWNGDEATNRLIEWAGGRFKLDPAKAAKVFLYRDSAISPKMATAYKFPFADVVGGQVKIIPAAVFAAAAVLRGGRGGTKIAKTDQQAMRGKITKIYSRMRDQFKDPKIRSPFEAVVIDAHAAAMRDGDSGTDTQPPWRRSTHRLARRGLPRVATTASATSWAAQVAQAVPDEPPSSWFDNPRLTGATKIRVTDEGRVYGHIAAWDSRHAAYPDLPPPRNRDKTYSKFHRHPVRCADGTCVKTGPLASGGHSSTDVALSMEAVQSHYDDPRYLIADVVCGEDAFGIWVSGALRPGVSPFQVMLADRYSFSGDWRMGELLAACSVSVPGFHLDADQEVTALTAAAAAAGLQDLPVLAEATPEVINDDAGAPAVLIAAGVLADSDGTEFSDALAAEIDGLGTWLSGELAAMRKEFSMNQTTAGNTEQILQEFRTLVLKELADLRAEFGLQGSDCGPGTTEAGSTEAGTGQPTEPRPDGEDAGESPGTDEQNGQPAPAQPGEATPGNEPAPQPTEGQNGDTTGADTTQASASGTAVAELKTWLADQFSTLRTQKKNADAAAATTAAIPAPRVEERQALAAFVHGADASPATKQRTELAAFVHAGREA